MYIKQKIIVDKKDTSQFQIVVRDETGLYSLSNPDGYGGDNGNPVSFFNRYIFDLYNKNTNYHYRQIQSDNVDATGEYVNPSLARIANKENVYLNAINAGLVTFSNGVYILSVSLEINSPYSGDGFAGEDLIVNVQGAEVIYQNYNAISVNGVIYKIRGIQDTALILDRSIESSFDTFLPVIQSSESFVLSDQMEDLINQKIASYCPESCSKTPKNMNDIAEIQLYNWGLNRAIDRGDYNEAYKYMNYLMGLCKYNPNGS